MTNAVYTMIVRALAGSVSERAAETMLRAALREQNLTSEGVSALEMQGVLSGPLLTRLSAVLPQARARTELRTLASRLEVEYPKAPTLFSETIPVATWDEGAIMTNTGTHWQEPQQLSADDLNADDFEFDDPDYTGPVGVRTYALDSTSGQDDVILDFARMQGVMGVMVCRSTGEVLRVRAMRDAAGLSSVVAATALLFQKRSLKLMSADLGGQTVCMRPLGQYCVAVVAGPQVNVGRLLAELGQVQVAL
ncbi:MAG: dynein regulation protein [Deinococcus sp.]|nr:dynein regulation protein [Deinococcus sp.]